jgi:hypothetical protein
MKISAKAAATAQKQIHAMQERWKEQDKAKAESAQRASDCHAFAQFIADCISEEFDKDEQTND